MDFLGDGNFNDSSRVNGSSFNFNNSEDSKMRSACDGRFSWTVHGPLIVVSTLIVILNSIVLALMRRKERLQTLSNTILASLAVSDLMSGLFGIALFFGCSVAIMAGHIALCVSSTLFMRFTAVSTVLHFLLVACDRHIMITFSLRYQALVNKCRVRGALIAIWLMSTLVATVELTWFETKITEDSMEKDKIYSILFIVVFLAVPLLSILCIYGHIIVVSTRHLLALRARRTNLKDEATNARFAWHRSFDLHAGCVCRLLAPFLSHDPARLPWCQNYFRHLVEAVLVTLCSFYSTRDKPCFVRVIQERFQGRPTSMLEVS